MFKTKQEIIVIQAEAKEPIQTRAVFWSHDKGTAKLLFQLKKGIVSQTLAKGTIVPICLVFNGGRHIYHAVIEDAVNGIVSIVLEDNILGYVGRVEGSIYIELPDSRSLDTAGRFTFDIKRSPIDENVPELEDYYWQGFNEIMNQYHQTIATIKLEAKTLLDSLTADVTTAQNKVTTLEQSITTANTNLNTRINEINKKIDDNDVFTKQESSANVVAQLGGAESAILKKEMLVDGFEGTGSRYIKDIPGLTLDDPLYKEYGIVPGQPNLISGIPTSVATNSALILIGQINLSDSTLRVGDSVTASFSGKNNSSTSVTIMFRAYSSSNDAIGQLAEATEVAPGADFKLTSLNDTKIPENTASLRVYAQKKEGAGGSIDDLKIKVIKGTLAAMDEWTPTQSESGQTIVNNGMVPLTQSEYDKLTTEAVRAETKIVNRGAEMQFDFNVIETLEAKYPFIFEGPTTIAEKITKFKEIQPKISVYSSLRGGGLLNTTNQPTTMARLYIKFGSAENSASSLGIVYGGTLSDLNVPFSQNNTNSIWSDGSYKILAVSKKNDTTQDGAISDGTTPAWVEVKDVRLIIELEVNGRTIIESIIAANHRENLATPEEAKAGTDTTKMMTPATTAQSIDNRAVTLASNQTIGGIKNFKDGLMINDVSLSTITRKVIYEADGVGGYFNAADKFTLGASGKIDKIVLLWSRVDDTAGTLLNYSWSQTVLSPDDLVVGNSYRIQMTTDNYKFVTFANESGNVTISGANENSVAPNRIYRIKRIIAYLKN